MIPHVEYGSHFTPVRVGNINLYCYILNSGDYILPVTEFQKSLGYEGKSECWFRELIIDIRKFIPINSELIAAFSNPIIFNIKVRGEFQLAEGISIETLRQSCNILSEADYQGFLSLAQLKFAKNAKLIAAFISEANLAFEVSEVTGFNLFKEQVKKALSDRLVSTTGDSAMLWITKIEDALFSAFFKTNRESWKSISKNLELADPFLIEIIYSTLPDAILEQLRHQKPKRSYRTKSGARKDQNTPFADFLHEIQATFKASGYNRNIVMQLLKRAFPKIRTIEMGRKQSEYPKNKFELLDSSIEKSFANLKLVKHQRGK